MNGVIVEWNGRDGKGLIKTDAGEHYNILRSNWQSDEEPKINKRVKFKLENNVALHVSFLETSTDDAESKNLEYSNFFKKLTEYGLHNYASTFMMLLVLALSFSVYKASSGGFSYDVSVSSGLTGFLFIIATLAFSALSISGVKPQAVRWLGVFISLVVLSHLLSVYFIAINALESDSLEGALYNFFERINIFNSFLLSVSLLLAVSATVLPKKINPNFASEKELCFYRTKGASDGEYGEKYDSKEQKKLYISYALLASAPFTFVGGVIAVFLSHIGKSDNKNELYIDHYRYIIKTFWFSLVWLFLSIITSFILIGIGLAVILFAWFYYRVINGCLKLSNKQRPYKAGR